MKRLAPFFIPLSLAFFFIIGSMTFMSCEPKNETEEPCSCQDDSDTNTLRKPNIYIYPETAMQLEVELSFPKGGKVIHSIPDYGEGWNVMVNPDGVIDDMYRFLFFESTQPDGWQYEKGWIKSATELESFFTANMKMYGFSEQEIDDFLEYWMPLLGAHPNYAIYPQDAEDIQPIVELNLSVQPDHLLRLYYVIKGLGSIPTLEISDPEIPETLAREGFYVTEWGGILK